MIPPNLPPHAKLLLGSELSRWGDLDFLSDPKSESRRFRPDTAVDGPDVELYLLLFRTSPRVFGIQGSMGKARPGNVVETTQKESRWT